MDTIENIRLNYPLPITKLYTDVQLESDPRLQIRKLVDLFEGIVRHLSLVGLASYIHYQLVEPNAERARPGLEKPSLGHWVNLLKTLTPIVETRTIHLLGSNSDQIRKLDAIGKFIDTVNEILDDTTKTKRPKLHHFLDTLVEFRNKKIGHNKLIPLSQAKRVVHPLELALLQWLDELSILQQQKLVYIAHVEWQTPRFVYRGVNLNSGDSLSAFSCQAEKYIDSDRLYLHSPENGDFLPLYPFFHFDSDSRLLYVYHELSKQQQLTLRCPYEVAGSDAPHYLDLDKAIVLGSSIIEKIPDINPVVDVDLKHLVTALPIIEIKSEPTDEIVTKDQAQKLIETIVEISAIDHETLKGTTIKPKRIVSKQDVAHEELKPFKNFDTLAQELEERIRQVCHSQARYPVLWIVGAPCTGKTLLLRSLCQRVGWKYVDFTLDTGYLDRLVGQEETYRIEDFQEVLHSIKRSSTEKVIVIDEIEPLLTLWNWDEQEIFFRKTSKTTRLQCGFVLVTHQRKAHKLESLLPNKNQVFEIPEGVGL